MKAWQLLEDPSHWTQGDFARDKDGHVVDHSDPAATCWCTVGALRKLYTFEERHAIFDKLRPILPRGFTVTDWNDSSTHATVLAKLKELDI